MKPGTLLKVTLLHGCFSRFLNYTNSTKSRNEYSAFWVHIIGIHDDVNWIGAIIAEIKWRYIIFQESYFLAILLPPASFLQLIFSWIRNISSCATDLVIPALAGITLCHIFTIIKPSVYCLLPIIKAKFLKVAHGEFRSKTFFWS